MQNPPQTTFFIDLRLLGYAIGLWVGAVTASFLSIYQVAGFVGLIALFAFRSRTFKVLLLAFAVGAAIFAIRVATLDANAISELVDSKEVITIQATVTSEPRITRPRVSGSQLRTSQTSFLIRTRVLDAGSSSTRLRLPLRVISKSNSKILPGQVIEVSGRLISTPERRVVATLISSQDIEVISEAALFSEVLTNIRTSFREKVSRFSDEAGALIPGMIIGDTSLQSIDFSNQMRRAGLSHITAVSGANFAIVSSLVFFLFRRIIPTIVPRIIVTSLALSIFLLLVRPSPSVLRAGVMAAVILFARATGNMRHAVSSLAAAITLLVLLDPFQSLDPGFILSVLATSGLIFLSPILSQKFQRRIPESLAELIAVPCAATIMCTPYLLLLTGQISLLSILFNVMVSPMVAPITILGFISLLTMPIDFLSSLALTTAHFLARWITVVASWSDNAPLLGMNIWFFFAIIFVGLFFKFRMSRTLQLAVFLIALTTLIYPMVSFPGKQWKIVQCDVGQGDALVINLGSGSGILFDSGPDPALLLNCLRKIGISKLPLVVLSHGHADHYFGATGLEEKITIGEIWSNGSSHVEEVLGKTPFTVKRGMKATISDISLEVLWPQTENANFTNLQGDGSAENNKSVVVLVTWNGVRILVTGDIEPEVQSLIAREYDLANVDILKVPHHGSRFQDSKFLQETSASIALISVGRGNSYGHPSSETLRSLESDGASTLRTDTSGPISVAWRFDDSASRYIFTTRTLRKEWWLVQWL